VAGHVLGSRCHGVMQAWHTPSLRDAPRGGKHKPHVRATKDARLGDQAQTAIIRRDGKIGFGRPSFRAYLSLYRASLAFG